MARTVEAILKANVSGFNSNVEQAAAKMDQLGKTAVAAGAKVDAGLAKGGKSAGALGVSVAKAGSVASNGLDRAAASSSKFNTATAAIARNGAGLDKTANGLRNVGLAAGVGIGAAIKVTADFDRAISQVAASGPDAARNIGALRKAAIDYGASTSFSAKQVADAEGELAKAGISVQDSLGGGLKGALDLAAAGQIDVADAASIAASAMTQFGKSGADVPHIADLLSAAADAAQGGVSDLGAALNQSGLVASQFGLSIEDTTTSLALFAKNGLLGSDAGTSFKTALTSLFAATGPGAAELQKLGISAYDAAGNFRPMSAIAEDLKNKIGSLGDAQQATALKTIFGSDAIRAGSILAKEGASGFQDMSTQVNDFGHASEAAATRMNNLSGDVEKLGGSIQSAFINSASGATGPLRTLTQGVTGLVDGFNDLSAGKQNVAFDIAGVGAAAALGSAGVLKIAKSANEAKIALTAMKISATTAGIAAAGVGAGIGLIALAFSSYATNAAESRQRTDDLTSALMSSKGAIDSNIAAMRAKSLEDSGALRAAQELGISISDITQASLGNADAQARVNRTLDAYSKATGGLSPNLDKTQASINGISTASDRVRDAIGGGNKELATSVESYKRQAEAADAAAGGVDRVTGAITENGAASSGARAATEAHATALALAAANTAAFNVAGKALTGTLALNTEQSAKLSQSLFADGDALQSSVSAHSAYAASVDAAAVSTKKHETDLSAHSLAIDKDTGFLADNTDKQRAAGTAIGALASSGKAYVQSLVAQGASSKEAAAATATVREQFVKAADAAGLSRAAANKLADSYGLIPANVSTKFETFGLSLQAEQVKDYGARINALPKEQRSEILAIYNDKGAKAALTELGRFEKLNVSASVTVDSDAKKVAAASEAYLRGIKGGHPKITTASDAKKVAGAATGYLRAIKDKHPRVVTEKDLKAAQSAVSYLKAIRDKHPKVVSEKDLRAAEAAVRYLRGIKDKHAKVDVSSNAAAVAAAARRALASVHDQKVTIDTYYRNHGGSGSGPGRAEGGIIPGYSPTPKADNIPIMATAREFMQPVASVDYYGLGAMEALRTRSIPKEAFAGYANGGEIGRAVRPQSLAAGGAVQGMWYGEKAYGVSLNTLLTIDKKIVALNNPLASVAVNFRQVGVRTKQLEGAQRDLTRIQHNSKRTAEQVTAAQEKLKTAQDNLTQASENLGVAQASLADAARTVSSGFRQSADSTSTDPVDVLQKRKETTAELTAFNQQLLALRKAGLNDQDLTDIVSRGAQDGGELAAAILKGGKGMVDALNLAEQQLTRAADKVGITTATGVIRRAYGGEVHGPGGPRGDKIPLLASDGEFMVNAAGYAANRDVVQAANAGRNVTKDIIRGYMGGASMMGRMSAPQVVHHHHNVSVPVTNSGNFGWDADRAAQKIQGKLLDSLVMTGLAGTGI